MVQELRIFPKQRNIPEKKPKSFILYPFEMWEKRRESFEQKEAESLELITVNNGDLEITQKGINQIGEFERIPDDHESLLRFWTGKLPKCPAEILKVICNSRGGYTKDYIAEQTGYSENSGGFNNGLSKLKSLGLMIKSMDGEFFASKEMFK